MISSLCLRDSTLNMSAVYSIKLLSSAFSVKMERLQDFFPPPELAGRKRIGGGRGAGQDEKTYKLWSSSLSYV